MYRHFLIPTDGSKTAAQGVRAGIELARHFGARITFLTAMPRYRLDEDLCVALP